MSDFEMGEESQAQGTLEHALDRWLDDGDDDGLPALLVALELAACGKSPRPRRANGRNGRLRTDPGDQ